MRRISILGSTGSIGSQALEVIAAHSQRFSVGGLAARRNVAKLAEQANRFRPQLLSLDTVESVRELRDRLTYEPAEISWGAEGLARVATADADCLLAATDGMASLDAVLAAFDAGVKRVALANKELAVSAGELLFARAATAGAQLLPVDSEHSAVFQCLLGERPESVARVVLTASGGPFYDWTAAMMRSATPEQALMHPTWAMGPKNTLDSATLINKGLEVIEASRFFDLRADQIEVVIHRQSIAHALVFFKDGNVKAQLAWPDMKVPIGFALAYPERLDEYDASKTRDMLGLTAPAALAFEPVDARRFPGLSLCYAALRKGGTYPAVLSAANETAGRAFLQGKVKFTEICEIIKNALEAHAGGDVTLEGIRAADSWARTFAGGEIERLPTRVSVRP
jgi:1-deoxy-D-xylulose-5-phosphate reductoisomerase